MYERLLSDKQFRLLAGKVEVSPGALKRLLGSLLVAWGQQNASGADTEGLPANRFDLGLRLAEAELSLAAGSENLVISCAETLQDYRNHCPVVFGWIVSGNFNPTKFPERVNRATLLHACRTIGRLRAKLLKELRSSI